MNENINRELMIQELSARVTTLTRALRLTVEYVGLETLPAGDGWDWFDALQEEPWFDKWLTTFNGEGVGLSELVEVYDQDAEDPTAEELADLNAAREFWAEVATPAEVAGTNLFDAAKTENGIPEGVTSWLALGPTLYPDHGFGDDHHYLKPAKPKMSTRLGKLLKRS